VIRVPVYDRSDHIRLLNADVVGEHDAIVHYLQHAWALADSYGPAIESIARDEMRHLKWLCHTIVRLGGVPDLRVPEVTPPASGRALFLMDLAAEEQAIAQYTEHRRVIRDPGVEGLLARIVIDEEDHRRQFSEILDQYRDEPWHMRADADVDEVAERLQEVVAVEYGAILQALWRSFLERHRGTLGDDWEERAIDDMKHLGWMGEALARRGVWARFPVGVDVRAWPGAAEAEEVRLYDRLHAWAEREAPEWAPVIDRIRRREAYQRTTLGRRGDGLTLGSLAAEDGPR
jgi:bacterioferritin